MLVRSRQLGAGYNVLFISRDKKKPQLPLPLVQFLRSVVTTAVEQKANSRGKDKVAKAKARQELMAKATEQLKV
jgi:hypothetical protein